MGDYSRTLQHLGITHIIVGILLLICGIGDRLYGFFWMKRYGFGIWIGVVMMITGFLGIAAGRNKRPCPSCAFLFFAIISSLLGLMIVLLYGISVSTVGIFAIFFPVAKAVSYGMIVLGVIETIIGLMATVCSCLSCCSSTPPTPEQRVMYNTGTDYILVQGPDGLPMAVPVQGKAGGSTIQGAFMDPQKGQPQVMPMPIPGVVGHQPQAGSPGLINGQLSTLEAPPLYQQLMPMLTSGEINADTSGGTVVGHPPQLSGMY